MGVKPRPLSDYWPIFGLRLATPRLKLAPLQDADLPEILELILGGIHDRGRMPFSMPWTDAAPDELIPNTLRYYWTARGSATPTTGRCRSRCAGPGCWWACRN